jgi:hypothetical protein
LKIKGRRVMATYVFAYRSPKGYAPGPETIAPWTAWFESMGGALVDIGKPAFKRCVLGRCGAEDTELGGYSFVTADNLEVAVALAKGCPMLGLGGGVEVGELTDPPARATPGERAHDPSH